MDPFEQDTPLEGERKRTASVLQEAYYQETLAKKTVELSFQEENAKQEKKNLEMQIDAVLSDLSPAVDTLLKACAKLTGYEGPLSQINIDGCIAKMEAEIRDLEDKNDIKRDEQDQRQTEELQRLWASLERAQQQSAEELWAENLMDNSHSHLGEKSTFRDQFREMMEDAVRRAVDAERQFNYSVAMWERNYLGALNAVTQRVEEDLRASSRAYYSDRENKCNRHAESLRAQEGVWLSEISHEREYVRGKIDVIIDQNYSTLASHCLTANRAFSTEYQAMLKDLSEYRSAYRRAKLELAKASEPPRPARQSSRRERSGSSPEKRMDAPQDLDALQLSSDAAAEASAAAPPTLVSMAMDESMRSNMFFGTVPKKTMAFETFSRIHRMELEAIGDPAQRHLALSKKLKADYALQSGGVLKAADAAMEDLRAMYFKRIIGMRDAFVNRYHGGGEIRAGGITLPDFSIDIRAEGVEPPPDSLR